MKQYHRYRLFKLLLLAGSVFLGLAIAEAVLQVLDYPSDEWSPWVARKETCFATAPYLNQRQVWREYDLIMRTNSLGLRDDPIGSKRGFRILLLGDSFTFGHGVERGKIYADLLEDELRVEIINAGVEGYEIINQIHYFRAFGMDFKPDMVVYALHLGNDLTNNGEYEVVNKRELRFVKQGYLPLRTPEDRPLKLPWLAWHVMYKVFVSMATTKREIMPYPEYLVMSQKKLGTKGREFYKTSKRLLLELADLVNDSGIPFFVFSFSFRTAIEHDAEERLRKSTPGFDDIYDLRQPERETTAFMKSANIDHVNINDLMRAHYAKGKPPLYFRLDGHFSEAGHRFVAKTLSPLLRKRIEIIRTQRYASQEM